MSARPVSGPEGSDAIFWTIESRHPQFYFWRSTGVQRVVWELRQRGRQEDGSYTQVGGYINMVWPNPRGPGWLFWTPSGEPGTAATTWRPTRALAMRALVRATLRERKRRFTR